MFAALRFVRGVFGLFFALQVLQVIEGLALLFRPEAAGFDTGKIFALMLIKVVFLTAFGVLFFWLRSLINKLHTKRTGSPHPALAEKRWAL